MKKARSADPPKATRSRLDDAARAGWLYYIAGKTQDEIAQVLNVSRPTAQRLVSLALSERLITFRLDHPVAACMALAARLSERYGLRACSVEPADEGSDSETVGIAEAAAGFIEGKLDTVQPIVMAVGTGRTLRAAVEQVSRMVCPQHKLVSVVGDSLVEGAGSFYDVLARLSDLTQAPHFPMPLPVVVRSPEERDQLAGLEPVKRLHDLARAADVTMVGIGRMDERAQLLMDGFISAWELAEMRRLGAVGEIVGWSFDAAGRIIAGGFNERLTSVPLEVPAQRLVMAVAQGTGKVLPVHAALSGGLVNGLITNETTAQSLLAMA